MLGGEVVKEHFLGGEAVKEHFLGGVAVKEHFLGSGEAVKGHFCCLCFFLAAAAHRFLDKFLVWKINFCTRPTGPPWRGAESSRACKKLTKSQALAAGHA